jgi:hypothetical protein
MEGKDGQAESFRGETLEVVKAVLGRLGKVVEKVWW